MVSVMDTMGGARWRAHIPKGRLRVADYEALAETGIFDGEKVELLDGVVVPMSPQTVSHSMLVAALNEALVRGIPPTHQVRPALPMALSEYSMPEPDFAIVRRAPFRSPHPAMGDLLVEVSASSLAIDRGLKAVLYAKAGARDYWVVDAKRLAIIVHRDPTPDGFASITHFESNQSVRPLAFPELAICLDRVVSITGT
jgi:Uma2 family endonuclease